MMMGTRTSILRSHKADFQSWKSGDAWIHKVYDRISGLTWATAPVMDVTASTSVLARKGFVFAGAGLLHGHWPVHVNQHSFGKSRVKKDSEPPHSSVEHVLDCYCRVDAA